MHLVFPKKKTRFKPSYSTFIFVDFDNNTYCLQSLLFGCFVIEIGELLTADTMGQKLCLQHG